MTVMTVMTVDLKNFYRRGEREGVLHLLYIGVRALSGVITVIPK